MKLELISREPVCRAFDTPLLFIHGTGHAAWCWDENFLPYFAEQGFSSHALSLRGHGQSEGREKLKWTRISDYVEDVHQAAVGLKREPVLIGHSLGGLVVQKYLEKHNAAAAVLVAPSPSEGMFVSGMKLQIRNPLLFAKIALKQDYAVMFATPRLARKFLFSADVPLEEVSRPTARFGSESYRAALEMIYNLPRRSRVPTLVVGAANDALIAPAKIEKTARAFGADCRMFPDMAHDMMLERGWRDPALYIANWLRKTIT